MSKTSGDRIIPLFWLARSLTSPEEVLLLIIEEVNSNSSKGSWAAGCIADDFPETIQKRQGCQSPNCL